MEFWARVRKQSLRPTTSVVFPLLILFLVNQSGCGKGQSQAPELAGLSNFRADLIDQSLYLSFRAESWNIDQGVTLPIPTLETSPPSTLALTPDLSGKGAVFQATIALSALGKLGGSKFPLSALPNGMDIPDTRSGAMPRWDMATFGTTVSLFLSEEAFGVYLPIEFKWANGVPFTERIRVELTDANGNRFGSAYWIGRGGKTAIFVLIPFTTSNRR